MIFTCDKYDNIRRQAFKGINGIDDINFQTGNKIE